MSWLEPNIPYPNNLNQGNVYGQSSTDRKEAAKQLRKEIEEILKDDTFLQSALAFVLLYPTNNISNIAISDTDDLFRQLGDRFSLGDRWDGDTLNVTKFLQAINFVKQRVQVPKQNKLNEIHNLVDGFQKDDSNVLLDNDGLNFDAHSNDYQFLELAIKVAEKIDYQIFKACQDTMPYQQNSNPMSYLTTLFQSSNSNLDSFKTKLTESLTSIVTNATACEKSDKVQEIIKNVTNIISFLQGSDDEIPKELEQSAYTPRTNDNPINTNSQINFPQQNSQKSRVINDIFKVYGTYLNKRDRSNLIKVATAVLVEEKTPIETFSKFYKITSYKKLLEYLRNKYGDLEAVIKLACLLKFLGIGVHFDHLNELFKDNNLHKHIIANPVDQYVGKFNIKWATLLKKLMRLKDKIPDLQGYDCCKNMKKWEEANELIRDLAYDTDEEQWNKNFNDFHKYFETEELMGLAKKIHNGLEIIFLDEGKMKNLTTFILYHAQARGNMHDFLREMRTVLYESFDLGMYVDMIDEYFKKDDENNNSNQTQPTHSLPIYQHNESFYQAPKMHPEKIVLTTNRRYMTPAETQQIYHQAVKTQQQRPIQRRKPVRRNPVYKVTGDHIFSIMKLRKGNPGLTRAVRANPNLLEYLLENSCGEYSEFLTNNNKEFNRYSGGRAILEKVTGILQTQALYSLKIESQSNVSELAKYLILLGQIGAAEKLINICNDPKNNEYEDRYPERVKDCYLFINKVKKYVSCSRFPTVELFVYDLIVRWIKNNPHSTFGNFENKAGQAALCSLLTKNELIALFPYFENILEFCDNADECKEDSAIFLKIIKNRHGNSANQKLANAVVESQLFSGDRQSMFIDLLNKVDLA